MSVGYQGTRGSAPLPTRRHELHEPGSADQQPAANADAAGFDAPGSYPLTVVPSDAERTVHWRNSSVQRPAAGSVAFATARASHSRPAFWGNLADSGPTVGEPPVGQFVGTPAFFNYFRPSGPNPSFAAGAARWLRNALALRPAALRASRCNKRWQMQPVSRAGSPTFNSVDAQLSDAASWYNALTVNLQKNFSRILICSRSYTWSHSIDNGTDLQSTLGAGGQPLPIPGTRQLRERPTSPLGDERCFPDLAAQGR